MLNKIKAALSLILALALCLSMAACGTTQSTTGGVNPPHGRYAF